MIEIKVNSYPPSTNQLYNRNKNGSVRLSDKHRIFREMVLFDSMLEKEIENYPVEVEILVEAPDKRKRDLDNIGKVVLDSLVAAKVIKDDSNKYVNSIRIANTGFLCDGVGKTTIRIKSSDKGA
jgi:Holliday junction resolvase RusA-like endonuclease